MTISVLSLTLQHTYEDEDDEGGGTAAADPRGSRQAAYAAPVVNSYRSSNHAPGARGYAASAAANNSYAGAAGAGGGHYSYAGVNGYSAQPYAAAAEDGSHSSFAAGARYVYDTAAAAVNHTDTHYTQVVKSQQNGLAMSSPQQLPHCTATPGGFRLYSNHGGQAAAVANGLETSAMQQQNTGNTQQQHATQARVSHRSQLNRPPIGGIATAQQMQAERPSRRAAGKSYKESDSEDDEDYDDGGGGDAYEAEYKESDDVDDAGDGDEWEADDYKYAQQLQEEWNGLRSRSTRSHRVRLMGAHMLLNRMSSVTPVAVVRPPWWGPPATS